MWGVDLPHIFHIIPAQPREQNKNNAEEADPRGTLAANASSAPRVWQELLLWGWPGGSCSTGLMWCQLLLETAWELLLQWQKPSNTFMELPHSQGCC